MIHYHGTPMGGPRQDVARFMIGRHALIPFPRQEDIGAAADACQSFILDNGAFTVWKSGGTLDVPGYVAWVREWCLHPGFDWALIPDVIDGDEWANDSLIYQWADSGLIRFGVPVWHLHESLDRLARLSVDFRTVAIGSSGQWATPGTAGWWRRMNEAMAVICDAEGRPRCRLHGLRMLDPEIFSRLPLASADSTNAAVNSSAANRFGMYMPPTNWQRAAIIAERIEAFNSAPVWIDHPQIELSILAGES
jgi:hypothetical protein